MSTSKKPKKAMGRGLGALFLDNDHENPDEIRDIVGEIDSIGAPKPDGSDVVELKPWTLSQTKVSPGRSLTRTS